MFYFHTKPADYIKYFTIAIALGTFNSADCGELKKNFSKNTEAHKSENHEKNISVKNTKKIKIPWRNKDNCVADGWEFKGVITDSQNESFTLRDLIGDVVILIFSTTWCPNCPDAVRQLDSLNEKLGDLGVDNVKVMHLNIGEESQEEIRRHLNKINVSLEAHKSVSSHLAGVSVIPSVLIIDKKGKPVCGYVGGGFDYLSDEFVKFIIALARE